MIEFELLNRAKLEDFIHSEVFSTMENLPISKHRALSQLQNPRAEPDDILLILAYSERKFIGYVGILPDRMYSTPNIAMPCGWVSCIWADSTERGKNIGAQLLQKATEITNGYLIAADYVPQTLKMYKKTGSFAEPWTRKGIRLYHRLDLKTIALAKKPALQTIAPLLGIIDNTFNAVLDMKCWLTKLKSLKIRHESIQLIDEEVAKYIKAHHDQSVYRRDADELNWIMNHPWVLTAPMDDESRRYYFSSVAASFGFHCFKLYNPENDMVGFLMFSLRTRTLKLPYCYLDTSSIPEAAKLIESLMVLWRVNTFTTFYAGLVAYFEANNTIGLYKKPLERSYMMTREMKEWVIARNENIQDGDGDCVFT